MDEDIMILGLILLGVMVFGLLMLEWNREGMTNTPYCNHECVGMGYDGGTAGLSFKDPCDWKECKCYNYRERIHNGFIDLVSGINQTCVKIKE